jgi:NADPH:quinone reductase-like Zn-dependent oxidoreductase/SAM-dependent methyltransferase/acyl carrier protein
VLEVGTGTGGTTAVLLPEFPPGAAHYSYTDVSSAFFPAARERFRRFDFVRYQTLDLDADLKTQGFADASYDMVIASNALHTASDLTASMRRLARLLTDSGHLLAVELTNPQPIALVFGLLGSFWAVKDKALRPDAPLLTRKGWTRLLEKCGFRDVVYAGDTQEPAVSDCAVIVAARSQRVMAARPPAAERADAVPRRRLLAALDRHSARTAALSSMLLARLPSQEGYQVSAVSTPEDPEAWTTALIQHPDPVDIVLLADNDEAPADDPMSATERAVRYCAVLRAAAIACEQAPPAVKPTLWLVVHTAQASSPSLPPGPGAAAALWGAARCLANEQPQLAVRRIGLSWPEDQPDTATTAADAVVAEMSADTAEDEVLLTAAGRFASRLRHAADRYMEVADAARGPYALTVSNAGPRYQLDWMPAPLPAPGAGEVLIAVRAIGLNYRDIMMVTGQLPHPAPLANGAGDPVAGLECAGTVIAVGHGVSGPVPGDRVMTMTPCSLGSHALASAANIIPMPEGMTFAEAATLPIAFLTVHHALDYLARLARGETLLVHGAAGGVGLAAMQYARHAGARVIATAGTPAKRDLLRLLGAEHVLNSRTMRFAEQVMDLTSGQGVDVVLNSLAGEGLTRSLGVLKPHGRFIELGKRDIVADNPLPLRAFERDISFFGEDIYNVMTQRSPLGERRIADVTRAIHSGVYRPLPYQDYPAAQIREAFSHLQHSRHVGKVVVTLEDPVPVRSPAVPARLRPEATYLVTGGLSGLGAATARHLANAGARHLALVSRRGTKTPQAAELLAGLRGQGVAVTAHAADAADPAVMSRIFDDIRASGHPLAGVVHAAMVLDDAPLTELSDDRVRAVLIPKMTAGYLIDQLTRALDLDFLVFYSSFSATIGNFRQSPYAAANVALDALALQRHRAGLPALSVRWGAIADTGYVHRGNLAAAMTTLGLGRLPAAEALAILGDLMSDPVAEVITVAIADWGRLAGHLPSLAAPRTAGLVPAGDHDQPARDLRQAIAGSTTEEALTRIEDALTGLLANIMQTSPQRIDHDRRLDLLGVDSLMATDLTTRIREAFGCDIPALEITGMEGLTVLARRIRREMARPTLAGTR